MWIHAAYNGDKVIIIDIKTTDADPLTAILIVFVLCSAMNIQVSNTPADFIITE